MQGEHREGECGTARKPLQFKPCPQLRLEAESEAVVIAWLGWVLYAPSGDKVRAAEKAREEGGRHKWETTGRRRKAPKWDRQKG